jgi:hypothetical protein
MEDIQRAAGKISLSDSSKVPTADTSKLKGFMYITIGPQCAGKTTILRNIFGASFHKNEEGISEYSKDVTSMAGIDITIDDQALVYIPVPINYFLQRSTSDGIHSEVDDPSYLPLNQVIYDKSIEERIRDSSNDELTLVVQRLSGIISAEEFAMRRAGGDKVNPSTDYQAVQVDLVSAVEHIVQLQQTGNNKGESNNPIPAATPLPRKIDLFIVESVFRPRPLELMTKMTNEKIISTHNTSSSVEGLSAIDQAHHLFKKYATNSNLHSPMASISWGNTNTRPREFQFALESAAVSGRPVEFIVFGGMEACTMIRDHVSRREYRQSHGNEEGIFVNGQRDNNNLHGSLCLPKVDRRTLLVRNLQRFLETGRYIPSSAISDAMVRVESMLAQAVAEAKKKEYPDDKNDSEAKQFCSAKFRLDFELAKLAGYRMNADRTISLDEESNASNQSWKRNQSRRYDDRNHHRAGRYHGRRSTNGGRGGRFGTSSGRIS